MSEISVEVLLQEKDELEQQIKTLEEGAVHVIMEKEKIIIELQEEILILNQNFNGQNGSHIHEQISKLEDHFHLELQGKEEQIQNLQQMLQELHMKMESESCLSEERMKGIEHQTTEKMLDTMNLHLNTAKDLETHLIEQLRESDEKFKQIERQRNDQEDIMAHMKLEEKNIDFSKKLSAALQKITKQEKNVEEVHKNQSASKEEHITELQLVTKVRDECLKNIMKLEKESRRLHDLLNHAQKDNELVEVEVKQLKDKLWIEQKLSQEKLIEQDKKFQHAKHSLQTEINKFLVFEKLFRLKDEPYESRRKDSSSSLGNSQTKDEDGRVQGQGGTNLFAELENSQLTTGQDIVFDFTQVISSTEIQQVEEQQIQLSGMNHSQQLDKQNAFFPSPKKNTVYITSPVKLEINQLDNVREENDTLRDLIIQLKIEIDYAVYQNTTHEKAIELLQSEIKNAMRTGGHEQCFIKERQLIGDLETFKSHSFKLETHFMTAKQQWAEEQNFLNEELKYVESSLLEAKTLLAQTTIEKEYFQSQMRGLQAQIKKSKTKKIEVVQHTQGIKETDYNSELEHMEMVKKNMKRQEEVKQEEKKDSVKKKKTLFSYFQR